MLRELLYFALVISATQALDYPNYSNHPCKRSCDGKPMTCYYELTLEEIYTMGPNCLNCTLGNINDCFNQECLVADGRNKLVYVYNRMLPGPSIDVCLHDRVVVKLTNLLSDQTTSIHWHGMHQRRSNEMDGVPFVTQCPINPSNTFTYNFVADVPGTHFYHSHSGLQRPDGPFSSLIVREERSVHQHLYDEDLSQHVMVINDWTRERMSVHRKDYLFLRQSVAGITTAIMINGRGATSQNRVPETIFKVKHGYRYRFRAINAGSQMCPITISIDKHTMSVIALDGNDVEPIEVDSLTIEPGERADFILEAKGWREKYIIEYSSTSMCDYIAGRAILWYENRQHMQNKYIHIQEEHTPINKTLNCVIDFDNENCIQLHQMKRIGPVAHDNMHREPDFKYYLGYDFYPYVKPEFRGVGDNSVATLAINNITYHSAQKPLVFQSERHEPFCNAENTEQCDPNEMLCNCLHVVEIPRNALVELILVHEAKMFPANHPMHLHGYSFHVVGMGKVGISTTIEEIKRFDAEGALARNFDAPVMKDTISIPPGGFGILRFVADNVGYWFLHCHLEMHMDDGMALTLKVGKEIPAPTYIPIC